MSDEFPRPTQGSPADRPPPTGQPAWWGQIERPGFQRETAEFGGDEDQGVSPRPPTGRARRSSSWFATGGVVVVALLLGVVALGGASPRGIAVTVLVLGVPALLATAAVIAVLKRGGDD